MRTARFDAQREAGVLISPQSSGLPSQADLIPQVLSPTAGVAQAADIQMPEATNAYISYLLEQLEALYCEHFDEITDRRKPGKTRD